MKRYILRAFLVAVTILLLIWIASLVRCEVLTNKYGYEFQYAYRDNTMIDEQAYCKVLAYTDTYACVYSVANGRTSGNLLEFVKEDGTQWKFKCWKTVWSTTGSADGFIWPYIR